MKTIYVVQNSDDEPVMAFTDHRSAHYVAENNDSVYSTVYATTLVEEELKHE